MVDTKISALTAASAAATGNEFAINEAGTSKKVNLQQIGSLLFTRINGSTGASGEYKTLQKLSSNSADNTAAAPAVVMTTTGLGVGTWHFKYVVLYQTAATTTGIKLIANHTGTVTRFNSIMYFTDNSATASTGVGNSATGAAIGRVFSVYAESAKNTGAFSSVGVQVANSNVLAVLEGSMVVSVSGNLELKIGTEVVGSAVRIMADSVLELTKIG